MKHLRLHFRFEADLYVEGEEREQVCATWEDIPRVALIDEHGEADLNYSDIPMFEDFSSSQVGEMEIIEVDEKGDPV